VSEGGGREMSLQELIDWLPRPAGADKPTHRAALEYGELMEENRCLLLGLAHAYNAWTQEGWEGGPASDESMRRVADELANAGLGTAEGVRAVIKRNFPDDHE
jgi:hypothetical protein